MSDEDYARKGSDIVLMIRRLSEGNVLIEWSYYDYRNQWHIVLTGNDEHVGGIDTTHAYLSGAMAVMDMYELRSDR